MAVVYCTKTRKSPAALLEQAREEGEVRVRGKTVRFLSSDRKNRQMLSSMVKASFAL
jgi:hypothetical protein